MAIWNTARLTRPVIDDANIGLSVLALDLNGAARSKGFYEGIAAYYGVGYRTVRRWFGFENPEGGPSFRCIPHWVLRHRIATPATPAGTGEVNPPVWLGYRVCELVPAPRDADPNDYAKDNALRRVFLCALAGYAEDGSAPIGLRREPIFNGEDFSEEYPIDKSEKSFEDKAAYATVTDAVKQFYLIYTDQFRSSFWERAWYWAYILETPNGWRLVVWYRGRDIGEGSDAPDVFTDENGNIAADQSAQTTLPEDAEWIEE